MGQIYFNAYLGYTWLGEERNESNFAIILIRDYSKMCSNINGPDYHRPWLLAQLEDDRLRES